MSTNELVRTTQTATYMYQRLSYYNQTRSKDKGVPLN